MKTKRILAVLLALTMIIGMFPVIASAQTDEVLCGESADSLTSSGTLASAFGSSSAKYIKLQSNVTITSALGWEGEKTVDLNGYTITAEGCSAFAIFNSTLNLIDTSDGTKGKVVSSSTAIYLQYNGALNIGNSTENSGGFTIETESASLEAIYVAVNSVGVNVYQPFTAIGIDKAIYNECNFNGNNIPFNFEGTIFNAGTISNLNATGYSILNVITTHAGSLHITGGTYKSQHGNGLYMLGGEVALEGGTFESEAGKAIYIVSSAGATYADLLKDGCYYTDGESDTEITSEETLASASKLTVLKKAEADETPEIPAGSVASVTTADGETSYHGDINSAIGKAQENQGSTLKLLDNIDASLNIYSGKFTIDLNGKTWQSAWELIVLHGNTEVKIIDSSENADGLMTSPEYVGICLWDESKLEIAGGNFSNSYNEFIQMEKNAHAVSSELLISGGKFVCNCVVDAVGRKVTVTGGEFECAWDWTVNYTNGILDLSNYKGTSEIVFGVSPSADLSALELIIPEGATIVDFHAGTPVSELYHGLEAKIVFPEPGNDDEIVKYDEAAKSAIVSVKEAGTYSLIFAKYGEGNRLDKVDIVEFDFKKGENTVPQENKDFALGTGDKIMLWQNMTTLVPLCEAYIVK